MKIITIAFENFWPGFDPENNFFLSLLSRHYSVKVDNDSAYVDIRFYSYFSKKKKSLYKKIENIFLSRMQKKMHKISIFFSGEDNLPNLSMFDITLSGTKIQDDRIIYFPLWFLNIDWFDNQSHMTDVMTRLGRPIKPIELVSVSKNKKNLFCSAVFRNQHFLRLYAVAQIEKYGKCDIYGKNNAVKMKLDALDPYIYNLCFENSASPGYVTEKLIEAKICGCVPIYYGHPLDESKYNKNALINMFDHDLVFSKELFAKEIRSKINDTPLLKVDPVEWFSDVESEILIKIKEML
jgi:hypothetical protein